MIEELDRFIKTAQNGNITKTAEKIFITQSALSQSIKRLENELGTKLFIQKDKHLQLTSDGKAVVAMGTKILQLWQNAKDPNIRKATKQTFAIGVFDNAALHLGKYFQNTIISDALKIELTIDASGRLFPQLQWGKIDIAICVVDKRNALPKTLTCIETFQEDLIPVSAKRFKGSIDTIPFIFYNQGSHTREQINKVFSEHNITPIIFADSTSTTFMKELAMLGSGVALLPKNFVASELKQGLLKKQKLPFAIQREYGVYVNNQSRLSNDDTIIKEICKALRK